MARSREAVAAFRRTKMVDLARLSERKRNLGGNVSAAVRIAQELDRIGNWRTDWLCSLATRWGGNPTPK
jgi:hypothetical protein